MEVVCSRWASHNLDVVFLELLFIRNRLVHVAVVIAQIQEPFKSSRAVFRPLPIHPMRQVEHQTWLNTPLALTRDKIVIDNNRSPISKVSKLCLPNDQNIRISDRVTIFITTYTILTQMTVTDRHFLRTYGLVEIVFLNVVLLVTDEGVSVRECASFHVLAR